MRTGTESAASSAEAAVNVTNVRSGASTRCLNCRWEEVVDRRVRKLAGGGCIRGVLYEREVDGFSPQSVLEDLTAVGLCSAILSCGVIASIVIAWDISHQRAGAAFNNFLQIP